MDLCYREQGVVYIGYSRTVQRNDVRRNFNNLAAVWC